LEKIEVCVSNKRVKIITYFEVVAYDELGLVGCLKLKYNMNEVDEIKKCETDKDIRQNYDVFTGLGKFPEKVSIKL